MHLMKRVFGTSCRSLALDHPLMLISCSEGGTSVHTICSIIVLMVRGNAYTHMIARIFQKEDGGTIRNKLQVQPGCNPFSTADYSQTIVLRYYAHILR